LNIGVRHILTELIDQAKQARELILEAAYLSSEGHVPSSFSIVEALIGALDFLKENGASANSLVLSKGHASLGFYAVLSTYGLLSRDEVLSFCSPGSRLGGHPDSTKSDHFALSSGSLGHGLPFATGLAQARFLKADNTPVVCLLGDGELNEGSCWEAALIGCNLGLGNLFCLVDDNKSSSKAAAMGDIRGKFEAFGWRTFECDGHNSSQITEALLMFATSPVNRPTAIILETLKGKGVTDMESDPSAWHHRKMSEQEYASFLEEVHR
jgi:transketolase